MPPLMSKNGGSKSFLELGLDFCSPWSGKTEARLNMYIDVYRIL